jgi:hypothetical protein
MASKAEQLSKLVQDITRVRREIEAIKAGDTLTEAQAKSQLIRLHAELDSLSGKYSDVYYSVP